MESDLGIQCLEKLDNNVLILSVMMLAYLNICKQTDRWKIRLQCHTKLHVLNYARHDENNVIKLKNHLQI